MKKPNGIEASMNGLRCCTCSKGHFRLKKINYVTRTKNIDILVKNLWVEICDSCGEMLFSGVVSDEIDRAIIKVMPNYFKEGNARAKAYADKLRAEAKKDKTIPTVYMSDKYLKGNEK